MRVKMDTWTIVSLVLIGLGPIGGLIFSVIQIQGAAADKQDILDSTRTVLNNVMSNLETTKKNLSETQTAASKLVELQQTTSDLNDSLAKEIEVQRQTNQMTSKILQDIKAEHDQQNESYFQALKTMVYNIDRESTYFTFGPGTNIEVSPEAFSRFGETVDIVRNLLANQKSNPLLFANPKCKTVFEKLDEEVNQVHWQLNGYDSYNYSKEKVVNKFRDAVLEFMYLWPSMEDKNQFMPFSQ